MMPASLLPNTLPPSNSEGFSDDSNLTLLAQHQLLHLRELRQAADSVAVQPRKLQSAPHDRPFDRIGHPPSQGVEGRAGDIPARTAASSGTWPASGARIFVIMRMMVLLPAPLRPSRAGESGPGVGDLLAIRHDHGTAYLPHTFQHEPSLLRIDNPPPFVREPQGNRCPAAHPILKENLLWVPTFATVEDLRSARHELHGPLQSPVHPRAPCATRHRGSPPRRGHGACPRGPIKPTSVFTVRAAAIVVTPYSETDGTARNGLLNRHCQHSPRDHRFRIAHA